MKLPNHEMLQILFARKTQSDWNLQESRNRGGPIVGSCPHNEDVIVRVVSSKESMMEPFED